jgi:hypothetical protein
MRQMVAYCGLYCGSASFKRALSLIYRRMRFSEILYPVVDKCSPRVYWTIPQMASIVEGGFLAKL